jgi:hypothetical protein
MTIKLNEGAKNIKSTVNTKGTVITFTCDAWGNKECQYGIPGIYLEIESINRNLVTMRELPKEVELDGEE